MKIFAQVIYFTRNHGLTANPPLCPPNSVDFEAINSSELTPSLSLHYNCDLTAIRLRYDYDDKLTLFIFC